MFFTGLSELMQDGQTINLNLLKRGDKLFVCLIPKVQNMSESAMNQLIPLKVEGTAAELDQAFLETISQPVQERFGLISNVDAFRDNTKSAGKKSSSGTNTSQAGGKEGKGSKTTSQIEEAEKHENAQRWPEAYAIYKKLSAADPKNRKLKEKAVEVWSKMAQKPLFSMETDTVTVETEDVALPAGETVTDEPQNVTAPDATSVGVEEEVLTTATTNLQISMDEHTSTQNQEEQQEEPPVDMFARMMEMANSQV